MSNKKISILCSKVIIYDKAKALSDYINYEHKCSNINKHTSLTY